MQKHLVELTGHSLARGILTLLAVLTIVTGYYFFDKDARNGALARAEENLQSVAYALSVHVDRALEQADQINRVMRRHYIDGTGYQVAAKTLYKELDPTLYPQLGIIDAKGIYVYGTTPGFKPVDLSDRKHFRVHADGKGDDFLYISPPVLGRVSGKLTLQLSRRIDSKTGKFLGVSVVSINPEQFTTVYRELIGKDGIITLTGMDGINRIRVDSEGFRYGQDLSKTPWFKSVLEEESGFLDVISTVDGQRRLTAFRQITSRRLFVTVGMPYKDIEQNYLPVYHRFLPWITVFLVLVLLILYYMTLKTQLLNKRLQIANSTLAQSVETANEATSAKSRFLSSVSHELRTPLHGILGHAELMSLEDLPPSAKESAGSIFQSAQHLLRIVNQLLDISKTENGSQELELRDVEIRAIVDEVIRLHNSTANRLGTTLVCQVADRVPAFLHTDATALKRILHNLVDNGLKFTKAGVVRVAVDCDDEYVRFEVTDSGIGISPSNQRKLFTNYTQVHEFDTREVTGTGLGLAMTRSLVELLDGEIGINSEVGKGSTFWFLLPRRSRRIEVKGAHS